MHKQVKKSYDWPSNDGDDDVKEVLKTIAHPDNRAGAPNRKYLRFPEIGANEGADAAKTLHGDPAANERRRGLAAKFLRAIAQNPEGSAHVNIDDAALKRILTECRTLSTSDGAGGYTIPQGFIADLIRDAERPGTLYSLVRKYQVSQTSGTIPRAASNATVGWGTENTNIGEGDPTFGETPYSVNRIEAYAALSRELVDDSALDIVNVVGEMFGEAIAAERDKVIAIGSGTGKPLGIYSASGITDVEVTELSYVNLLELKYAVDNRYHKRPAFRWMLNSNVFRQCLALRSDTGAPLFADAIAGEPPKILGVPYVIENSFPDNFIGIGDLSYYVWFQRGGMALERSADAGDSFRKYQVLLRVVERVDGKPSLPPTVPMARSRVLAVAS